MTDYERVGGLYGRTRRPDPRLAARIRAALGDARTVVNVGAGTGAYELEDRRVVAVEPSGWPPAAAARPADAGRLAARRRRYTRQMTDLLLHSCCGPCATVAVPAWRERGVEPLAWFANPNIQPAAEVERRTESMRRFGRAAGLELVVEERTSQAGAWRDWAAGLSAATPDERCAECLGLRLSGAAKAAADLGVPRFSTTLSVSPYQRHDLIRAAGERAAATTGVTFVYLDLRDSFRRSYAESRRLELYRQPYCGCAASKWEAWQGRRERKRAG